MVTLYLLLRRHTQRVVTQLFNNFYASCRCGSQGRSRATYLHNNVFPETLEPMRRRRTL